MRLTLDYGTDGLEVDLPDERVTVIEPVFRPAVADPMATLREAIRSPIQCAPLGGLVRPGLKVAISVCDITRAQPRREMLRALFDELPQVALKGSESLNQEGAQHPLHTGVLPVDKGAGQAYFVTTPGPVQYCAEPGSEA